MVSVSSFKRGVRRASVLASATIASALMLSASSAFAGSAGFGSNVASFSQGAGLPANYFNDPSSALGAPENLSGVGSAFPNVINPFSPAFDSNQVVVIGQGGQLTLQLSKAITVANAPQLGVISNVGLIDVNYPNGQTTSPASIFGGGIADVRVSSDNVTWADLGNVTFNTPSSPFSKLGNPYETAPTAADTASDFGKPFTGTLSSFDGQSLPQTLATLNGSIGGTWLNLSGTNLKTVDFVQFRDPLGNPWTPGNPMRLAIDAVTISDASTGGGGGTPVPLPAAAPAGLIVLAVLGAWSMFRGKLAAFAR